MPLSDAACRSAKPGDDKPYKISDAGGLFLLVEKNGSRLWRQAYRFDGKQRLIALGAYPAISLAAARTAGMRIRLSWRKALIHRRNGSWIGAPPGSRGPTPSGSSPMN